MGQVLISRLIGMWLFAPALASGHILMTLRAQQVLPEGGPNLLRSGNYDEVVESAVGILERCKPFVHIF